MIKLQATLRAPAEDIHDELDEEFDDPYEPDGLPQHTNQTNPTNPNNPTDPANPTNRGSLPAAIVNSSRQLQHDLTEHVSIHTLNTGR